MLDEDRELLVGKRGAPALGFVLLLKHYSRHGRFPRGRSDLADAAIGFVADQIGVPASDLGFYEWFGSTIEYRSQIRSHLGFRLARVADQDDLTLWLAGHVANVERRPDRFREALLTRFRSQRIEPPTSGRLLRMVRSALRTAEQDWAVRLADRVGPLAAAVLLRLVEPDPDEDSGTDGGPGTLLGLIKAGPGNISLDSMMSEIGKLVAVPGLGLPVGLFQDVAPNVVDGWRARAAVEAPSHLRRHPPQLTVLLLAALVHQREREITDTGRHHRPLVGAITLSKYEAAPEPRNLRRVKAEVQHRWGTVALIDILKETVLRTGCLAEVSAVVGSGTLPAEVLAERLMLAIYAYGTNTGIRAVAAGGGHGHSEDEIRYVRRRYLTRDTAQAVAIGIANATFAARQQSLWGEGRPLSRPTRRTFGPMTRTFSPNGTLATAGAGS